MTHMLIMLGIIWLATAGCMLGLGYELRGWLEQRRANLAVPYRLSLEGYRATAYSGAADPGYQLRVPAAQVNPAAMMDDALSIAERQISALEAHREAEAIWLEVEGNPDLWRYRQ